MWVACCLSELQGYLGVMYFKCLYLASPAEASDFIHPALPG